MNFTLEWQEQYASNDLFFVVNKATNRLNYPLARIKINRSHATVDMGFLSSPLFHQWVEYESKQTW